MGIYFDLILDNVQGHQAVIEIGRGRISRMGLAIAKSLPVGTPSATKLLDALAQEGLPQLGDSYPAPGYEEYYLKARNIRALNAIHYPIELIYEWRGMVQIREHSTVQTVQTQLHPKDFAPLYVNYTLNGKVMKKQANFNTPLPVRHITVQATVQYQMSPAYQEAFGCVNSDDWMGKPPGWWLFSGLEAQSLDDGITWTYAATVSTKNVEDWSEIAFLRNERGHVMPVDEAAVKALRAKPYAYGQDVTVDKVNKVGMYPTTAFGPLFAFGLLM